MIEIGVFDDKYARLTITLEGEGTAQAGIPYSEMPMSEHHVMQLILGVTRVIRGRPARGSGATTSKRQP